MIQQALQRGLYTHLQAALVSLGVSVYDHVPDADNAAFPYVNIGDDEVGEYDTDDSLGYDAVLTLHTWSRERGRSETKRIQDELYRVLHRSSLAVGGAKTVTVDFQSSESFLDEDGLTRHGVSRFRVLLSEEA